MKHHSYRAWLLCSSCIVLLAPVVHAGDLTRDEATRLLTNLTAEFMKQACVFPASVKGYPPQFENLSGPEIDAINKNEVGCEFQVLVTGIRKLNDAEEENLNR